MILGHAVSMNTEEVCARGSTTISLRKSDGTTLFCSSMEPTWTGNPGVCSPTPKTTACLQGYVPKNSLGSWHVMEPTKSRHDFAEQHSDVWAEANWPCSSIAAISREGKGAKDRQGQGLLLPEPVPFDEKPVLRCKSCRVWCSGSTQAGTGLGLLPHDLSAWRRNNTQFIVVRGWENQAKSSVFSALWSFAEWECAWHLNASLSWNLSKHQRSRAMLEKEVERARCTKKLWCQQNKKTKKFLKVPFYPWSFSTGKKRE